MKKIITLIATLLFVIVANSQIRIASAATPKVNMTAEYDSTQNYLFPGVKSIYAYVGQDLLYVHTTPFTLIYSTPKVSATTTLRNKMQESFINKVFHVDSVFERNGTLGIEYVLKLHEVENDKNWYYIYPKDESSFPFLCLGFKEKYEQLHSSFDYYVRAGVRYWSKVDFVSGEHIDWDAHTIWKFKEYIYDPHHGYAGLFTNSNGQTLAVYNEDDLVPTILFDSLVKKYGQSMCDYAIKSLIKEGMPSVLLTIAWGKPQKIDTDSRGQFWFFENNIVRLENDKVVNWSSM